MLNLTESQLNRPRFRRREIGKQSDIDNVALTQLITLIVNQDRTISSWTQYLVTIQTGLLAGYGIAFKTEGFISIVRFPLLYGISILAIVAVIVFWGMLERELAWQKLFVSKVRNLKGYEGKIFSRSGQTEVHGGITINIGIRILSITLFILWLFAFGLIIHVQCCCMT